MQKRILFLQPDRIACYAVQRDKCMVDQEWDINGDKLPDELQVYLKDNLLAEFSLVFDLPEEECYREDLKLAGIRDRRYVVQRLKSKRFDNSLFSKGCIVGSRGKKGLLLSGVGSNALCESLILALAVSGVSLRSIHSSTTLTPELARQAKASVGAQLLVIPLQGCVRLVACMDSSVLFTRRVVLSAVDGIECSYCVLNQSIEETLLYTQRIHEEWMPVVVLFGQSFNANKLKSVRSSSIASSLVKELRNYSPLDDVSAEGTEVESLLLSAVARSGCGYAQEIHRAAYTQSKIRNVCAAVVLCSMGGAITSVAVANKLNSSQAGIAGSYSESAASLVRDIATFESSYDQPIEAVRQALVAARLIELNAVHEPVEFLRTLSPSVHRLPDISITSIQWETDDIVSEAMLANLLAQPRPLESIPLEQIYRVTLAGEVAGRPDSALDQFESFVSALRDVSADPSVVVVETPFGLGDQRRTTTTDYSQERGEFVVEISNEKFER